jgi:predicted GNAT superfamily acetyltransferase
VGTVQRPGVGAAQIEVRRCASLAEYKACEQLERTVWGEEITVPSPIFVVAVETGGQVLGAFEGSRMIGFTLALAGIHGGKPFLHSHMTAVLPERQNSGVGRMLKLLQREDALARGIDLVEWTFDPLELRNAYFNLVRLGAVVRRIIPNFYGITESPLHAGLPTDRLVAEWWLDSVRVKKILAGDAAPASKAAERIAVPADIGDWKHKDQKQALEVQTQIREQFERWFRKGYVATGLERGESAAHYMLEPPEARADE